MDYAGRDFRNIRYAVNRPLTDEERALRYRQGSPGNAEPNDFLSVIRYTSSYIDLVDRWYPITGLNVWLGLMGIAVSLGVTGFFSWSLAFDLEGLRADEWWVPWVGWGILVPFGCALLAGGAWLVKSECFRWTHYPMRLNRRTRQVHVFRQDGTVLTVPWDDLFIVRGEAKSPIAGTTYDLRAHVLDADGVTVRESFSLGYTFPRDENSMDKFWAFLQPYMEAADGVERGYRGLKSSLLMPLHGRKEGWRWSIVRTFAPGWPYPWTHVLLCVPLALTALGRMLAMWTSKPPVWPAEVEAASRIDANDPYVLTWRDNGPLGWWELWWPLLCTVLGLALFFGAIGMMLAEV